MPNIDNFDRLIEAIRTQSVCRFDIRDWVQPDPQGTLCGSVACIAGTAAIIDDPKIGEMLVARDQDVHLISFRERACRFLGIDDDLGGQLFLPSMEGNWPHGRGYDELTPEVAAEALEHCRDTGVVDWERALALYS